MGITPLRRAALLAAALAGAGVLGTACTPSGRAMAPVCTAERFEPLLLVAQSVPTAERIPCIASYPAGWSQGGVKVRSGQTAFTLKSDRVGGSALRVTLQATCDTSAAMEVRTDELGTTRHDRRFSDDDGFREVRTYRFPGGCVTYRFGFSQQPDLADQASLAVGFITRAQVDANARAVTNGKVHL